MTQVSGRNTTLSSASATERGRAAALTAAFLRGGLAAGLGLGGLAVLVIAAWISSPYPDSGAGGALHIAAALWLLAHGAELVRPDTLSGVPAPVGLVPLLVVALPVWLVYRSSRDALEPEEGRPQLTALGGVCTVAGGYLLVGAAVVVYARGGPLATDSFATALRLPLVPVLASAAGVWVGSGKPLHRLLDRLPGLKREGLGADASDTEVRAAAVSAAGRRRRAVVVLRSATAGAAVLLGGGFLLVVCSLTWHAGAAQESFLNLAAAWSGRIAVLLLSVALLPNAAVWGASYALGPGFALGTSATVTPLAVTGSPALPPFPLLAAVPAEGPGMAVTWAAGVVPFAAGLMIARFTVRVAAPPYAERDEAWSARDTALAAALAGAGCAVLMAALAAVAGGPLGTGRLVEFGPVWWLTGAAALVWTVGIGVPAALLVRVWRLRERRGTDDADEFAALDAEAEDEGETDVVSGPETADRSAASEEEPPDAPDAAASSKGSWWRRIPWQRGEAPDDGPVEPGNGDGNGNGDGAAGGAEDRLPTLDGAGPVDDPYDFLPMDALHDRDKGDSQEASGGPKPASKSGPAPEPEAKAAD
ncbi:cell division protein PerM [Streptomyces sp. NBC_01716]|uniref:cell division protein PerM n=1 Tax=Streptomyces sp. NBC_01716 TaxID=2975917 RepID=UPI002E31C999|nr:DUF6350 family protein [Streptomyces sp. NBC_01716]